MELERRVEVGGAQSHIHAPLCIYLFEKQHYCRNGSSRSELEVSSVSVLVVAEAKAWCVCPHCGAGSCQIEPDSCIPSGRRGQRTTAC